MPFVPELSSQLLSKDQVLISALPGQWGTKLLDPQDDKGMGSVTIPADHPDIAQFIRGRLVRVFNAGQPVFTWWVTGHPSNVILEESEEFGQVATIRGPGIGEIGSTGIISPDGGWDHDLKPTQRLWSYASRGFPNAGFWVPPTCFGPVGELDPYHRQWVEIRTANPGGGTFTEFVQRPAPLDFPIPGARWIWCQADNWQVGWGYFRFPFWLTNDVDNLIIAVTADNFYTAYLDGVPLVGEKQVNTTWMFWKEGQARLKAGQHYLGFDVENLLGVNGPNPAGLVFAGFEREDNVEGDAQITHLHFWSGMGCDGETDLTTCLAYPLQPPGYTAGQIMIEALAEIQARGGMAGVTLGFTAFVDSAGNPWPYIPKFAMRVMETFTQLMQDLAARGLAEFRMHPGALTIDAFNPDYVWGATSSVTLTIGVNAEYIAVSESAEIVNAIYARWSGGYTPVEEDTASITAHGRFEKGITVDAGDEIDALRQVRVVLNHSANPEPSYLMRFLPQTIDETPYQGFNVGDYITAPDKARVPTLMRVYGIAAQIDDEGNAYWELELNRRMLLREEEDKSLLEQIGRGLVGKDKISIPLDSATASAGQRVHSPSDQPIQDPDLKRGETVVESPIAAGDEGGLGLGPSWSVQGILNFEWIGHNYFWDSEQSFNRIHISQRDALGDFTVRIYVDDIEVNDIAVAATGEQSTFFADITLAPGETLGISVGLGDVGTASAANVLIRMDNVPGGEPV